MSGLAQNTQVRRRSERNRAFFSGAIAALLLFATTGSATADQGGNENHNFVILDSFSEGVSGNSEIYAIPESEVQNVLNNVPTNYLPLRKFCTSLDVDPCKGPTGLSLRIYLPVCSPTVLNYCIESMAVSADAVGDLKNGDLIGYTDGKTYPADPNRGVPEVATTSRWKVTNVRSKSGTDTYAAKLLLDGFLSSASNKLFVFQVSAVIEPYVESTNNGNPSSACTSWQSGTTCGERTDFAEGQKAQLSVRLPNTITGWLHGRFKAATIAVDKYDANQNRLTVSAETVRVPELNTSLTPAQFNTLPNPSYFMNNGMQWNSVNAGNPAALEWVKQLSGVLKDTATGEHGTWSFSTIPQNTNSNKCFQDKSQLLGLVMTNALVYAPGAPDFDGKQLNYQVGGLHFKSDGKTFTTGTYDLLMRSETARCLYNFTDAPLSASVTITTATGGEQQISTTVLNEKGGWLHLGAYGFTFSSPVLRVKLNGVPKTLPKANQTPSESKSQQQPTPQNSKNSPTKNYNVTCVKGKITKKIIAAKPMCPSGWKKK